jgi:DNA-binding transcriptional ArsR family regulator
MVNYREGDLDGVFSALGDATRRAMLARLARGRALSVTALAEPFDMTLPAVMKHLDVLAGVGLIRRVKTGRTVQVDIAPGSLKGALQWLQRHERFWSAGLDRLTAFAEAKEREFREKGR